MAVKQQSPMGIVSSSLGLLPPIDVEDEEDRRRKRKQLGELSSQPGGLVSNMMLGSMTGAMGGY